jgi:hypothetical protein
MSDLQPTPSAPKRSRLAWAAAAFGAVALLGPASALAGTRRVAVILGNNAGSGARPELRFAELDARKLAGTLMEVGGLAKEDIHLLTRGRLAEARGLLGQVSEALKSARRRSPTEQQVLIFFFSGHSDGSALELGRDRLPFAELRTWMRGTGADVKLTILDTCQSGSLLASKGGKPGAPFDVGIADQLDTTGEAIITSSAADEVALESQALRGSFFSHGLVSGLRGAADVNGDGRVTLYEAYHYASASTVSATATTVFGAQHPGFDFRMTGRGELVLAEPSPRNARLEVPAGFDRVFLLRAGSDQVLAEVGRGSPARLLAMRAGVYGVRAWRGKRAFTADVTLAAGERRALRPDELVEEAKGLSQVAGGLSQVDGPDSRWMTSEPASAGESGARRRAAAAPPLPVPTALPPETPPTPTAACGYACELEVESGRTTCGGSIKRIEADGPRSVFVVSMAHHRRLEITADVCDPKGYVLLVADSPGSDGGGGDNGESFYDAEVEIRDFNLTVYPNDMAQRPTMTVMRPGHQRQVPDFVARTGCSRRTLHLADGWFWDGIQPPFPMSSPSLLRINPPPASEGVPDALWYVGINRSVYRADRTGTGVRHLRFCQRR